MKNKMLAMCIGLCLILCSGGAFAQKSIDPGIISQVEMKPLDIVAVAGADLTVTSAKVLADPIVLAGLKLVLVPLEITVENEGTVDVTEDFNVGAEGRATDGNVYGFEFVALGEDRLRGGVLCTGLAAGASKTYQGFLVLVPQPITAAMQAGSTYEITAMVDYNLDPDAPYYAWGVGETDETNNELTINYPPVIATIVTPILSIKK
jgi:hypothetical protein